MINKKCRYIDNEDVCILLNKLCDSCKPGRKKYYVKYKYMYVENITTISIHCIDRGCLLRGSYTGIISMCAVRAIANEMIIQLHKKGVL